MSKLYRLSLLIICGFIVQFFASTSRSENQIRNTRLEKEWLKSGDFTNPVALSLETSSIYQSIAVDEKEFTHTLSLTFIMLRNSDWTEESVREQLTRIAVVYLQCGIKISGAELIIVDSPLAQKSVDVSWVGRDDELIAKATPRSSHKNVRVFLFRSEADSMKHDMKRKFAYAYYPKDNFGWDPLDNTVWISSIADDILRKSYSSDYSSLAHEVTHILCKCGHIDSEEKNLMNKISYYLNGDLTPKQCEQIKRSKFLNSTSIWTLSPPLENETDRHR